MEVTIKSMFANNEMYRMLSCGITYGVGVLWYNNIDKHDI